MEIAIIAHDGKKRHGSVLNKNTAILQQIKINYCDWNYWSKAEKLDLK
jgi:hypothetical protein